MKHLLQALFVFGFLLLCVRATPSRLQRSKEGCRACGRKSAEKFYEIQSEYVERKDVRETFGMNCVGDGGVICKACLRAVRRYKATGTKATPRVCRNDISFRPIHARSQIPLSAQFFFEPLHSYSK